MIPWCGVEEADKIPSGRHGKSLGNYHKARIYLSLVNLGIDDSAYEKRIMTVLSLTSHLSTS